MRPFFLVWLVGTAAMWGITYVVFGLNPDTRSILFGATLAMAFWMVGSGAGKE